MFANGSIPADSARICLKWTRFTPLRGPISSLVFVVGRMIRVHTVGVCGVLGAYPSPLACTYKLQVLSIIKRYRP